MTDQTLQEGEKTIYRTSEDAVRVELLYESEILWLEQRLVAELFAVDGRSVRHHPKEVYASAELRQAATLRNTWRVQRKVKRDAQRKLLWEEP